MPRDTKPSRGGEVWMSDDEGEAWRSIATHLPEIYSVVATPL